MASVNDAAKLSPVSQVAPARRFTLALFATTLFLSALLIFAIQPMFTKMVLPRLGGSPQVWSVAMVVFQAALFIGYLYAHLLARTMKPGWAAVVHLVFLALVATTLPLGIAKGFGVVPERGLSLWLAGLFFASIGLPFIALAASAPLLQAWFTATGHRQASNPYVLYAASNFGSFAALVAYPFLIEPLFPLQTQIMMWSAGFFALTALIAAAAYVAAGRGRDLQAQEEDAGARPTVLRCAAWCALAAIPSALVIAITAYISTDIAAAPFLWVLPLALYLLTFVAVFRERPWIEHATVQRLLPYAAVPLATNAFAGDKFFWLMVIVLNLFVFVVIALACHGEAYRTRPHRGRLTEFYLWIAFGGALGGIFAGLVAPNAFNNTYEYPLLLGAALLLLPGMFPGGWQKFVRAGGPALVAASVIALVGLAVEIRKLIGIESMFGDADPIRDLFFRFGIALPQFDFASTAALVLLAAVGLLWRTQLVRGFWLMIIALVVARLLSQGAGAVTTVRSFFGVHQVVDKHDMNVRLLMHGTTLHGAAWLRDVNGGNARPEPLTYYYAGGPLSEVISAARTGAGGLKDAALVGLGTGSLACYRHAGERWTFFEIDPEVVRIARNENLFRFLSACAPDAAIVTGDARLTLSASPERYDLIILDAFSSDAIPAHLLTREAFAGYLGRLQPRGVIAVHVSNRHMELIRVVAAVGAAEGLIAYAKQDAPTGDFRKDFRAASQVVALARSLEDLGDLPSQRGWYRAEASGVRPWSDDFSDVLGAILRKKIGRQ